MAETYLIYVSHVACSSSLDVDLGSFTFSADSSIGPYFRVNRELISFKIMFLRGTHLLIPDRAEFFRGAAVLCTSSDMCLLRD
jgi:hypothetical protein